MRKLILITFIVGLTGNSLAQTSDIPVKFSGQIRMRSEVDGRDFNSDSGFNTYTLLRTRFGVRFQPLSEQKYLYNCRIPELLEKSPVLYQTQLI